MSYSTTKVHSQRFSCELHIKDLEDGKMLVGDCEADCSPPDGFDMAKFHRGRQFFRKHLFQCGMGMYLFLVIGLATPELLDVLAFTSQAMTQEKAVQRYIETFCYICSWHYGNIWENDSKAYKSIFKVRQMHRVARENMRKAFTGRRLHKFISQYDMAVVLSGFIWGIVLHPEFGGMRCTLDGLDDYVYFWYGVGHLLGIQKKYNVCAYGLSQALTFCKSIEQDILEKNLRNPPPEFREVAGTVVQAFRRSLDPCNICTLPVTLSLASEMISSDKVALSFADTLRHLIWKLILFTAKHVAWFKAYLNRTVENEFRLTFSEE